MHCKAGKAAVDPAAANPVGSCRPPFCICVICSLTKFSLQRLYCQRRLALVLRAALSLQCTACPDKLLACALLQGELAAVGHSATGLDPRPIIAVSKAALPLWCITFPDLQLLCGDLQADSAAVDPGSADGAITEDGWEVFHFEGGLQEYVQWLNRERDALHAPITVQRQVSAGRWGTNAAKTSFAASALQPSRAPVRHSASLALTKLPT